jgi:hypothetical protein
MDHTFRYVYIVPKRNGADLLNSMFDLKKNSEFMNLETTKIEI